MIDPRNRNVPSTFRPYNIFFIIGRGEGSNLTLEYTSVSGKLDIQVPGTAVAKKIDLPDTSLPQIPMLTNPEKVTKGTKLLGPIDSALAAAIEAEKRKADKDAVKRDNAKKAKVAKDSKA